MLDDRRLIIHKANKETTLLTFGKKPVTLFKIVKSVTKVFSTIVYYGAENFYYTFYIVKQ
jgi:hypothetical protein